MDSNQLGFEALGTLYIDKFLCRLEIRSLELAQLAVRHFTQLFGEALIFKRILKLNLEKLRANHALKENKKEESDFEAQHPELAQNIEEKIYLNLLDQKNPFLNNMTPREACQDTAIRPLLIEWLKGLENKFERKRAAGERSISIVKIKQALGLDW